MAKDEARDWVEGKIGEMLERFGEAVSDDWHRWNGDALEFGFTAGGFVRFTGTLDVTEGEFVLDMPFPLMARGFEGRARTEVNRWLDQNLPAE